MNDKKLIYKTQMKEIEMEISGMNLSVLEKIEGNYRELLNGNDLSDKMLATYLNKSILHSMSARDVYVRK